MWKQGFNSQEPDSLAIEFLDTFQIKDLKIDLADKKVYQLIKKANSAKYYYH